MDEVLEPQQQRGTFGWRDFCKKNLLYFFQKNVTFVQVHRRYKNLSKISPAILASNVICLSDHEYCYHVWKVENESRYQLTHILTTGPLQWLHTDHRTAAVTTCWLQGRYSDYSVIYEVYVSLSLFYCCVRCLIVESLFSVQSLLVLYNNIQSMIL